MRAFLVLSLTLGLLAAGCVSAPDDAVEAASLAPTGDAGASQTVTLSETGATYDAAYLCSPAAPCMGKTAPVRGGPGWFEQSLVGVLDGAELVLTWEAEQPANEELLLGISWEKSEDEWDYVYAVGPSPLTLSESGLKIPAEKVRAVYVNSFHCAPTPVTPCVSTSQPFALEGTLTLLSAAPERASG